MTAHSIELIRRLCDSYDEYFPKITDDRLLAMTVNPVMATKGFDDIVKLLADDGSGDVLKARAKALLKQYILNVLRAEERAEERSQVQPLHRVPYLPQSNSPIWCQVEVDVGLKRHDLGPRIPPKHI